MANVTKEEFDAALSTVDPKAFEDHNWLRRVNTFGKVEKNGARVAAHLRDPGAASVARPLAPVFFDWLLSAFPASGDAGINRTDRELEAARIEEGRRDLAV